MPEKEISNNQDQLAQRNTQAGMSPLTGTSFSMVLGGEEPPGNSFPPNKADADSTAHLHREEVEF